MTIGIDLGSRFIKIAVLSNGKLDLLHTDTVGFYKRNIRRANGQVSLDLSEFGLNAGESNIIATGYGRNLLSFENATTISEIKAHFYGAKTQCGESNFTLVDIGGQDCKVIQVRDGYINDFTMNDKCAASTGRFIEQAANILNIPIDVFMRQKDNPCKLSDTCAVFCESEIIGQLAKGTDATSLAAGVNLSVARRLAPHIKKHMSDKVFASGGAAASDALLYFLGELSGATIVPLANTGFNGALGCVEYSNIKL